MINDPFLAARSYRPIAAASLPKSVRAYLTANVAIIGPRSTKMRLACTRVTTNSWEIMPTTSLVPWENFQFEKIHENLAFQIRLDELHVSRIRDFHTRISGSMKKSGSLN